MDQNKIKALLAEASQVTCSYQRINEIVSELVGAVPFDAGEDPEDLHQETMRTYLGALFLETVRHRREKLPALFPAFALACGDLCFNTWLANIDWSLC